ncbi:hypothetical protein [Sphingorhabdus sp.]|uniref:hypothetical protein n=1 Tax=Sphingorhabdus sp. TaxID=1902408 RepID=UPI00333EE087
MPASSYLTAPNPTMTVLACRNLPDLAGPSPTMTNRACLNASDLGTPVHDYPRLPRHNIAGLTPP